MARCGFCKATDLAHIKKGGDGGLEAHNIPRTNRKCQGYITSGHPGKQSRDERTTHR
jgi:hypothetical protein